jgi:hypothetical protein
MGDEKAKCYERQNVHTRRHCCPTHDSFLPSGTETVNLCGPAINEQCHRPFVAFSGYDSGVAHLRSVYPAQQIKGGRQVVNYSLPDALYQTCSAVAADVGSLTGRLYMMLNCRITPLTSPFLLLFDRVMGLRRATSPLSGPATRGCSRG